MKNIAIGSDHAGFEYKEIIKKQLESAGHMVKDFGAISENSVDYPDFAHPVANSVESNESELGILICGSGNGVAMTANKHKDIRAALCWNEELAKLSRQHNNANVLCLPARFVPIETAKQMTEAFIATDFEGGRHLNRINKMGC